MPPNLPDNVRVALEEVKQGLEQIYGDRLKGVYLYGSYARGEGTEASDVDVLAVLDGEVAAGTEILRMSKRISDISLDHDLLISVVPMESERFERNRSPFLLCVRRDALKV